MERFMDMSASFMDSVDLQNGVFEDNGLKMLEEYEKQSSLLLMGGSEILDDDVLDLGVAEEQYKTGGASDSDYEGLFD